MQKFKSFTFAIGMIVAFSSCIHKTDLTGLKEVSFSNDIQAIIGGNCTQSGCHDGVSEFPLFTYNDVMNNGEITAGDAHGSKLYLTISNHGFEERMPPDPLPLLSTDQIKLVYLWIEQGAKNN